MATPHKGKVSVAFVNFAERDNFSTAEYLEKIREATRNIPGARITVDKEANGPPTGKPLDGVRGLHEQIGPGTTDVVADLGGESIHRADRLLASRQHR